LKKKTKNLLNNVSLKKSIQQKLKIIVFHGTCLVLLMKPTLTYIKKGHRNTLIMFLFSCAIRFEFGLHENYSNTPLL